MQELNVGYQMGNRWFRHTEPSSREIRNYHANTIGMLRVHAVLHPFARVRSGLQGLAVEGSYALSFGLQSSGIRQQREKTVDTTGTGRFQLKGISTTYSELDVGLRYAFRLTNAPTIFAIRSGMRRIDYSFDYESNAPREIPSAQYTFVRLGLLFSHRFWRIGFALDGSAMYALDLGTLGARVPTGIGLGWEAGADIDVRVVDPLAIYVQARFVGTTFLLEKQAGRPDDARATVLDQFLMGSAGLRFRF